MSFAGASQRQKIMGRPPQVCALCGRRSRVISAALGVCGPCIQEHPRRALEQVRVAHATSRKLFRLPTEPPRTPGGVRCPLCSRGCRMGEGQRSYCGLRTARAGRLVHIAGIPRRGILRWYRDPLPTNCVAAWVCPASRQRGRHNLAVFYASCTLNCMFCQNWQFRQASHGDWQQLSSVELAGTVTPRTFCVCFFGGDPASQMPHALAVARRLGKKGVAVCWETAGTVHPKLLDQAVGLSLDTGGCVKFDLKALDNDLHRALTGGSNRQTLANFRRAARRTAGRSASSPLVASTLLVPGYVEAAEVGRIARFIADLDPDIPYSLLGFAPQFHMWDLPATSLRHAEEAAAAAGEVGLRRVHLGNRHLLV